MDNTNKIPELPLLDPTFTTPHSPYSKTFLLKLLDLFITQIPTTEAEIINAFNQKNIKSLKRLLHSLQGACVYCGLMRLKHRITLLKDEIQAGKFLQSQLQQLQTEIHQTIQLRDELSQMDDRD